MSQNPNPSDTNNPQNETSDSEQSPEDIVDISADTPEQAEQYEAYADALDEEANPLQADDFENMQQDSVHAERVAQLEEELAKTKDLMMRTVAEAENGRKRALKDREDAGKFAISGFARDLLSVADNLRRALEAMPENSEQDEHLQGLVNGVAATEKELLRAFEKHGVQKIDPMDKIFDPNYHEVMFETPIADKPNGTVIQVIEPGYILNGRIVRPAKVGVAKNDASGGADSGQNTNIEV